MPPHRLPAPLQRRRMRRGWQAMPAAMQQRHAGGVRRPAAAANEALRGCCLRASAADGEGRVCVFVCTNTVTKPLPSFPERFNVHKHTATRANTASPSAAAPFQQQLSQLIPIAFQPPCRPAHQPLFRTQLRPSPVPCTQLPRACWLTQALHIAQLTTSFLPALHNNFAFAAQ